MAREPHRARAGTPLAWLAPPEGRAIGWTGRVRARGTGQRMNLAGKGLAVDENCVFCRIIGGEEMVSLVYEDDDAIAFLDIQPMSRGHTLIATKEHYETLFDVPEDLAAHCIALARRLAPGLRSATGAPAINLFCANGAAGGQDVPHFHLHMIPVQEGEPFALQLPMEGAAIPQREELDVTAARISRALQDRQKERVGALNG